ncbi:MAG TPA: ABC transporter substrate-binding protein [Stellaceae bacterium]|nr:ABC transporter substrate-binding protein [Stellaceae bacterium]
MRAGFLLALGLCGVLALTAPMQPAKAADDAGSFIAQTADKVLKLARNTTISDAELKRQLHVVADQDFDAPRIAQFVLGRYWRTASDAQRQQFVAAFENYMVQVYASRFRQYSGAQFKVVGDREQSNGAMVTTEIERANEEPARVIWQLAKTPNGYKITDVSIEGISQAVTYRQEFQSVIEQNNGEISALIQQLQQKANG